MEAMRPPKRLVFDFETNAWVRADAFNVRAVGREIALPAPGGEPSPGRWSRPEGPKKGTPTLNVVAGWLLVAIVVAALATRSLVPILTIVHIGLVLWFSLYFGLARSGWPTKEDLRLLEDRDDPDVCLVALTIVRDGNIVGTDRGVAWFADGCLLYSGHRTSFALGGEDLIARPDAWGDRLALRVPHGAASVSLTPLTRNNDAGGRQEMRFLKALYHFRRRPPRSRIPRQWPPFEPYLRAGSMSKDETPVVAGCTCARAAKRSANLRKTEPIVRKMWPSNFHVPKVPQGDSRRYNTLYGRKVDSTHEIETEASNTSGPVGSTPSPGWWNRPATPDTFSRLRWLSYGLVLIGAATIVTGPVAHSGLLTIAGLLIFAAACFASLQLERRDRKGSTPLVPIIENLDDKDVCLVDISIRVNQAEVGRDRGAAWFEAGCLHYSGYRTSFIIGGQDVLPPSAWGRFQSSEMGLPSNAIPLRIEESNACVLLKPVSGDGIRFHEEVRFKARLQSFREQPLPSSQTARQWPPFEP